MAREGKSRTISTSHTDVVLEKLDAIIEKEGLMSRSAGVDHCIRVIHARMFPAYTAPRPAGQKYGGEEPRETVAEKTDREQGEICEQLGGLVEDGVGGKVCVFFNYHFDKEYEQRIPFGRLSASLLANQYTPSREAVEKARKGT